MGCPTPYPAATVFFSEQFVTNIGRAPRRVVPILRPVVQAMDRLGVQLPKAAAQRLPVILADIHMA